MSLNSCVSSNPPLVVFVASLFAFALTTFFLAVSVTHADKIQNPDTFDWNTFFFKISDLDFCVDVQPKTEEEEKKEDERTKRSLDQASPVESESHTFAGEKSVSLSVPISTNFIKNFHDSVSESVPLSSSVTTHGQILLDHLDRGRLGKYKGMSVELTLHLPGSHEISEDADQHDICIKVAGPDELIDDLNSGQSPPSCAMKTSEHTVTFLTHTKDRLPHRWCENGTAMELTYELQPQWIVYISEADKDLINMHLLTMSAFLVALGFMVSFCAFFKSNKSSQGFSRGMADSRGDMQMLSQDDF